MFHKIEVTAPSRLHFGLLSFGQPETRAFGGVGAMVDRPGVRLTIRPAAKFEVTGPLASRAAQFAAQFFAAPMIESLRTSLPACQIEIQAAPREHIGLGVGTSLGLAVAAGLSAFLELPVCSIPDLAQLVGRGKRSSIGIHGFAQGGFLVEAGHPPQADKSASRVGPLVGRAELPSAWRFVLIAPPQGHGLSGSAEREAFASLPAVPEEVSAQLSREVLLHLLPAALEAHFNEFSASLFRYGHLAGTCFAPQQQGPYASPQLQQLVDLLRTMGIEGVGQTSWGPLLFALVPSDDAAHELVQRLRVRSETRGLELTIVRPDNSGAVVKIEQAALVSAD